MSKSIFTCEDCGEGIFEEQYYAEFYSDEENKSWYVCKDCLNNLIESCVSRNVDFEVKFHYAEEYNDAWDDQDD